jgi:hypothetical protein
VNIEDKNCLVEFDSKDSRRQKYLFDRALPGSCWPRDGHRTAAHLHWLQQQQDDGNRKRGYRHGEDDTSDWGGHGRQRLRSCHGLRVRLSPR